MSVRARRPALVAALLALAPGGCGGEQGTELVLIVTSEFRAPQQVNELYVDLVAVDTAGGPADRRTESYRLGGNPGEYGMPATLSVRPGGTFTGRVDFTVELRWSGRTIAAQTAVGVFEEGRSIAVPIDFRLADGRACGNDPAEGVAGRACTGTVDCEGNVCAGSGTLGTFPGGYCLGQTSLASSCDPQDPSTCAPGSKCVYAGVDRWGGAVLICLDTCAVAVEGAVQRTNCDCRDGYKCDLATEVCLPGCTTDQECCEVWQDLDADGVLDDGEVVLVPGCDGRCDAATARCVYVPPAGVTIGAPCQHDSECPADAYCARRSWVPDPANGMCMLERCDLAGRACDAGSTCADLGSESQPWDVCVRGCIVGTTPADAGYRCAPSQACWNRPRLGWQPPADLPAADGYCSFGNWPVGPENDLYAECRTNSDCHVPLGIGMCMLDRTGTRGYCTVEGCTNDAVAPLCTKDGGVCGGAVFDYCSPSCAPGVAPASSGCPSGFACWDFGSSVFCYVPCSVTTDCGIGGTCNPISRGCES